MVHELQELYANQIIKQSERRTLFNIDILVSSKYPMKSF